MATQEYIVGKVGITPKGTYSAETTYERLDFVTDGSSSYLSLVDNNLGNALSDTTKWQLCTSVADAVQKATEATAAANTAAEEAEKAREAAQAVADNVQAQIDASVDAAKTELNSTITTTKTALQSEIDADVSALETKVNAKISTDIAAATINATTSTTIADTDYFLCVVSGEVKKLTLDDIREQLNYNQEMFLQQNAFYIEENTASSLGAKYVNRGGSELARQIWLSSLTAALMDDEGNYCRLNNNDFRYTADGDTVVSDGAVVSAYANADWMGFVVGGYWNYLQTVAVGSTTKLRHWISMTPLPGGWKEACIPAGMFKCVIQNSVLRSIPFVQPSASQTINGFFNYAQARSKNHGLTGDNYINLLNNYHMSKYGYRSVQETVGSDGTLIFGPGLDGTEAASGVSWNGFLEQSVVKTGACLSLGYQDGNVAVTDSTGATGHVAQVGVFEGTYGQYWEMHGHRCSVGTSVYQWDDNFLPSGTPTADSFANIEHRVLTRLAVDEPSGWNINMIATEGQQYVCHVPMTQNAAISYGDSFWYAAAGQLWIVGGASNNGSYCGLGCSVSSSGWSHTYANRSARLDFHGDVKEVSSARLKELLAA